MSNITEKSRLALVKIMLVLLGDVPKNDKEKLCIAELEEFAADTVKSVLPEERLPKSQVSSCGYKHWDDAVDEIRKNSKNIGLNIK